MPKAPRRREPARKATAKGMEDEDVLLRRGIYEKAKRFEERVAELFGLLGYRTIVDYLRDEMQFDVRLEMAHIAFPTYALVECKDLGEPVTQAQVREFASKVETVRDAEKKPYQAILVARSGFVNNAHAVAQTKLVHLLTFQQLLLSLVDLGPNLEAAIQSFKGTPLQRLYVEQDAVLEKALLSGEDPGAKGLTKTVFEWLDHPTSTFLALLGDFGCGKSSFCKRLAWELATKSKEKPGELRMPILIDLREGGSTTVTLENLLTHHFQRLSNQVFNPQALLHLNREGYLLLIFDGFDETIAYSEPARYLDNLRQILRAAEGKAKVLLTCRTHYFKDRPEVLKRFGQSPEMISSPGATKLYEEIQGRAGAEIGYVLEFREPQIEEYLKKALPPSEDWKAFREQIRGTYNLEELAERPFLLEIIVKTLPYLLERGAKVTIADLYETYCESWFKHTDARLTLTRDHKAALVEFLACQIWNSPEHRVHYSDLANKAAEFFHSRPLTVIEKERVDYEVRTALFLHRDQEGYYSFIHRSFLEFFIARTLRDGLSKGTPNCLNLKRITREVAFFLELWPESKKISDVTGKILEMEYQPGISENALLLLYFHACASLEPLVGPGSEIEDFQDIRRVFSSLRPRTLNLPGADLEGARIPGIDLSGANLEGAKLTRADLRQASLDGARLSQAILAFVDLRQGSAENADLSESDLNHLDAQNASFRGADLRNADLSFARFVRADLAGARRDGSQIVGTAFLGTGQLDLRLPLGHFRSVRSVAWSAGGKFFATGSQDSTIKLWDAASGRLLNTLQGHEDGVNSVTWKPGGEQIASASYDKTVRLWDATSGRLLNALQGHEYGVNSAAWDPGGERIASASDDNTVRLWDAASGRLLNTLQGHEYGVYSVAWEPDGERIASAAYDNTIRLWDAASGRLLNTLQGHKNGVNSVAWEPGGRMIASTADDNTVRLWDAASGQLLNTLQGHKNGVNSVAWELGGERIATASDDNTVRLWDAASGRLLNTLQGHENGVYSVAWEPGGERIASASYDNTVRFWDAASGRLLNTLQGHEYGVYCVAWEPGEERIASASYDDTVRLWDAASGRLLNTLQGHVHGVRSVSWAPGGERIASASDDHTVRLWDAASGRLLNTLQGHVHGVRSVSWEPSGERIASASDDNTVRLWDAASGRLLNTLQGHKNGVNSVAWEPGGARIASASDDKTVRLWDAASGRLLNTLQGHQYWVYSLAWAPCGERIAFAAADHTVRLWDATSGRLLNTLQGHHYWVHSLAWEPCGERIASASRDKTVRIWRPDSGEVLQIFEISPLVSSLAWTQDGKRLVLSFELGFTEIWDLQSKPPRPLVRLYHTPGSGFAATPDGYVSGPPEALEYVRFGDGWALYDLTDVPERLSPERVAAALKPGRVASPSRRGKTKPKG